MAKTAQINTIPQNIKTPNTLLFHLAFWTAFGLSTSVPYLSNRTVMIFVLSAEIVWAITAVTIFLKTLYNLWKIVQPQNISPGKAVGFLFIPLFNVYWCFVSIHDLTTHINTFTKANGLKSRVSSKLTLTYCVCFILVLVPFLNIPIQIAILIMSSLIMHQWSTVINEIFLLGD